MSSLVPRPLVPSMSSCSSLTPDRFTKTFKAHSHHTLTSESHTSILLFPPGIPALRSTHCSSFHRSSAPTRIYTLILFILVLDVTYTFIVISKSIFFVVLFHYVDARADAECTLLCSLARNRELLSFTWMLTCVEVVDSHMSSLLL